MPLKILISGAGVAGPALSAFLLRANPSHSITIIERSLELRKGGQQIDLRGQAIPVMRKLGLLDKVKERAVAEDGIAFMDASSGRQWAIFGRNDSGHGRQAFSSEYEIMRGDLVDVLYNASLDEGRRGRSRTRCQGGLNYKFGTYATGIRQLEGGAQVSFCDGSTEDFDLVVGADGQSSKTRRLVFGQEASDAAFKSLGVNFAYFRIPREQSDSATAQASFSSKKRFMAIRTGDKPVAQGYLGVKANIPELTNSATQRASTQKDLWAQIFAGAGWKSERLIRGMLATNDFYAHKLGQVKMDTWSKGRVVLVGDAGYCPSPMTGMGTACGIVGAYVLAGEISRFGHGSDIKAALESYERVMRPFVIEAQKLPAIGPGPMYIETEWGVWIANRAFGIASALKIDGLLNRIMPENKGGWILPEYPELNENT